MHELIAKIELTDRRKTLPEFRVGDVVRVHQRIRESGKERIQVFEGIVIAKKHGSGLSGTFTVRRIASGVGVERIFPLHSPLIVKIERTRSSKVRQAKLYYLRGRIGKKAKLKGVEAYASWQEPVPTEEGEQDETVADTEVSTAEETVEQPINARAEALVREQPEEEAAEVAEAESPVPIEEVETIAVDKADEEAPVEIAGEEETSEPPHENK